MDPRYVQARRVLLDVLSALEDHAHAIIITGAQAVYLRAGATDLAVAPYTTDGDLAVDPRLLGEEPMLEAAMTRAGLSLKERNAGEIQPGLQPSSLARPKEMSPSISSYRRLWSPESLEVPILVPMAVGQLGQFRASRRCCLITQS
jgi:hypothetical protein